MNMSTLCKNSFTQSPFRTYEEQWLLNQNLKKFCSCLDVGGGEKSSYKDMLPDNTHSVNIEGSGLNPTYVIQSASFQLPKKYDAIVCLNVLEHVYEYKEMIESIYRGLKPSGKVYIAVPFLYRFHQSPCDYWRYGEDTIYKIFSKFTEVNIKYAGTGLFMANYSNSYGIIPKFLRPLFSGYAYLMDSLLTKYSARYRKNCASKSFPIGYLIEVTK